MGNGTRSGNHSRVEASRRDKDGEWARVGPLEDNASDISILRENGMEATSPGKSGILATSTVVIDYEGRSEVGSIRGGEKHFHAS